MIVGDALSASEGRLTRPEPGRHARRAGCRRAVRKLAELDVQAIVCYHGGVVLDDAGGQLRRVAAETETAA